MMTREEALDLIRTGDLYDSKGYLSNKEYEALHVLEDSEPAEWIEHIYHGHYDDWADYECPICGKVFSHFYHANYCPNCGTRMKGAESGLYADNKKIT